MSKEKIPSQPVLAEEEAAPKEPSALRRILTRIGAALLLILALVFAYVFLLLGEPEEDAKNAAPAIENTITMPMSPFEAPGEANIESLAETFGEPVLSFYQGAEMRKARIYDTAFEGGYARCVTLTYLMEDGAQLTVESIRPTSAVSLIHQNGYKLDATALYALGGLNAARMENDVNICVFAQSDTAVYAVTCPKTHEEALPSLLRQTMLTEPQTQP
ncbi:MAG: hypothetical protein J6K55_06395 [Clostridia bacterium]|nr:hypothetical protein [Clostridia bacterium]